MKTRAVAQVGPTLEGASGASAVGVAASSTIESGGRALGPSSGGAAAALAVGGAVASTVEADGSQNYLQCAESRGGYGGVRCNRWQAKAALGTSVYPLLRNPSFSGIEVTIGSVR